MKRISVIIPTYKRAHFIGDTLNSLLQQTRVPDEILVVDDGSTDNTAEVLSRYGAPVRYIRYEQNQGRSHARNVGLQHATGNYIAFLDSDDHLSSDSIAVRARYLDEHPEVSAVYGMVAMTDESGHLLNNNHLREHTLPSGDIFPDLVCQNFLAIHTVMFRKTCLSINPQFDEDLSILEDWDFWLQLAQHFHFEYLNKIVAYYRQHDEMTMTYHSAQTQLYNALTIYKRILQMPRFVHLTGFQQARMLAWMGLRWIATGHLYEMNKAFMTAIKLAPLSPKIWFLMTRGWRLALKKALAASKRDL